MLRITSTLSPSIILDTGGYEYLVMKIQVGDISKYSVIGK